MENATPAPERKPNVKSLANNPAILALTSIWPATIFTLSCRIYTTTGKRIQNGYEVKEDKLQQARCIQKWLNNPSNPSRSKYAYEKLSSHLPFIKALENNSQQEIKDLLIRLFEKLNHYRNGYLHAFQNTGKLKDVQTKEVSERLKMIFEKAILLARKRNEVYLAEEVDTAFDPLQNDTGNRYDFLKEDDSLSEKGLAFFICLFLEKRYAHKFFSRLKGFKRADFKVLKATHLVFTHFCCQLPYPKLESKQGPGVAMLDIVNELHKIPDELYRYMSDTDKEKYRPVVAGMADTADEETADAPPPVMKRYEDRFYYLALRAIDEMDLLDGLRFQVALGKKIVLRKEPKIVLGQLRPRTITQALNIFHKLSTLTDIATLPKHWTDDGKKILTDVIEQYAPHYNLENNTIAIGEEVKKINQSPFIDIAPRVKLQKPLAFISQYDIPQLALYCLLHQQGFITIPLKEYITTLSHSLKKLATDIQTDSKNNKPPLFEAQ